MKKKKKIELLLSDQVKLLSFLRTKYKLYHLSNVFLPDLQYGVWEYLKKEGISLTSEQSEEAARFAIAFLQKEDVLRRLDGRTWMLNFPLFKVMRVQQIQLKLPTAA